ncbi:asparagine synthase (glutamine-hydrolyzing) [Nocardia sp. NPDC050406]|uniref:asparagine synthase (glutamine-hydrolyzing) n=1 Tax=Nocardia sp. NPDC050406 TaxID=3364318 RepID=UPI00379E2C41
MCGIVAALGIAGRVDENALAAAIKALTHRGPDGQGHWISENRRVGLGHTRLAVRDLEGGAQPVFAARGRVVAVVNGELYGTAALRAELTRRGHHFVSRGDSEVVAHAWAEWGPAMTARLHGEFAFVLWDDRDQVLFAARDRFGVKPLVWARHDDRILVASRVRGLFALGLPAAWDHGTLWQCAGLQYGAPDATVFAGASALPAGHWMLVRDGRIRIREYWDLDYPAEPTAREPEQAVTEFRARFDAAVAQRLEADVPVAFQLSGGLDSSAVLAAATRQRDGLEAFALSFTDGGVYDEQPLAAATAAHLGARLHTVAVTDRDLAQAFPDAVRFAEAACINTHAAAKLRLHAAVREAGFKVALTGEGADEILFGYPHLRVDQRGSLAALRDTNGASAGLMLPDGEGIGLAAVRETLGFVPTWLAAKAAFGQRVRRLLRPAWLEGFGDRDAGRALLAEIDVDRRLTGRGRVEQSAYLWTKFALEGYILRALGDGLEMANGVEGRLPFLDGALVEHVVALPTELKIREGVEKWLLRRAMRDVLPAAVLQREKHPFLGPPIGTHMLALVREVLSDTSIRHMGVFDTARLAALLREYDDWDPVRRKAFDPVLLFATSVGILHTSWEMSA